MIDSSRAFGGLRVGAAQVNVSPPLGTHLAGAINRYRPAEEILDPDELARAQRIVAKQPRPVWADAEHKSVDLEWMFSAALVDVSRRLEHESEFDYDIRVLRIGDAALVGLPGEPFVESGLRIKLGSPTFPTYVVHNTKFAGYIPTRQAFERGGYETKSWNSGKFRPGALELIADTAIETLRACFAAPKGE